MKKKIKQNHVCCERFFEWYESGEIGYAYEEYSDIDETEWYVNTFAHLYYCPFCGAFIKGHGFGTYDEKYPPGKETRIIKQVKA
jgi:hypothetical protein